MSKRIPKKEADLIAFIEVIIGGFKANPKLFTDPPLTFEQLTASVGKVNLSIDNVAQAKSSYEAAVKAKNTKIQNLYKNTVEVVDYCYRITKEDKALLAKVGLTPRYEKRPAEPPGQCRDFVVAKQEIGRVTFRWKKPETGGKVRTYIIQRKEANTSSKWENVWTELGKEAEIKDQPEGNIFDYRVRALNTSGIGPASNIVTVKF